MLPGSKALTESTLPKPSASVTKGRVREQTRKAVRHGGTCFVPPAQRSVCGRVSWAVTESPLRTAGEGEKLLNREKTHLPASHGEICKNAVLLVLVAGVGLQALRRQENHMFNTSRSPCTLDNSRVCSAGVSRPTNLSSEKHSRDTAQSHAAEAVTCRFAIC